MWHSERSSESPTALAAQAYLSQAGIMNGQDTTRFPSTEEICALGIKLKLFGVQPTRELVLAFHELPSQTIRQLAHAAWGAYAWMTRVAPLFDTVVNANSCRFLSCFFESATINFSRVYPFPETPTATISAYTQFLGLLISCRTTWDKPFLP